VSPDIEAFIIEYVKELREQNAAVFIGAGLSKSAGYVDWPGLLEPIAHELGLDAHKESDLVSLSQFHVNRQSNNRSKLNQLLIDSFADIHEPTETHRILARLPVQTFWTTNYDRIIEDALKQNGKRVDAKYTIEHLAQTRRGRDAIVFKMHGDVEHPDKAILIRDDYENYATKYGPFIEALSGDLVEHTFLFIGFSFTDPNLDYILSRIRVRFGNNQRRHYCITKRRTMLTGETADQFQYAQTRQTLVSEDLLRFNIKTLFIDNYSDIPAIMRKIEERFRRRTVFVSGSAVEYGSFKRDEAESFLSELARSLVDRNFRITSGFGLGVGTSIVTGAVQAIYSSTDRSIEEQLVLRPFPIGIKDAAERKQTFARYREDLISQAGIAIFCFGNKDDHGKVVNSEGVRAEFDVACARGLFPVPIGATGYVAGELWRMISADYLKYYGATKRSEIEPLFAEIGKNVSDLTSILAPLTRLIELLSED